MPKSEDRRSRGYPDQVRARAVRLPGRERDGKQIDLPIDDLPDGIVREQDRLMPAERDARGESGEREAGPSVV